MEIVYSLILHKMSLNDFNLFLLNKLGADSFSVKAVDLSALCYGEAINKSYCDLTIKDKHELDLLLEKGNIFILNFGKSLNAKDIYELCSMHSENRYIQIRNQVFPSINASFGAKLFKRLFIIRKALNNKGFLKRILYNKFDKTKLRQLSFVAGEKYYNEKSCIKIPSYEHDNFLRLTKNKKELGKNYHVFLDQNPIFHRDLGLTDRRVIKDPDKYYTSINRFFAFIEKVTGKEVIIALSPRTDHNKFDFRGRQTFMNKTAELVADADIVIAHYSASIYYPILFNKDLLLTTIDQLHRYDGLPQIHVFSAALDIPILNIDKPMQNIEQVKKNINKNRYQECIYQYLKSPDVPQCFSWEIINKELDQIIKGRGGFRNH